MTLTPPDPRPAGDVLNDIERNIEIALPSLTEHSKCRIQALRATTFNLTLSAHTDILSQAMAYWVADAPSPDELAQRIKGWRSYVSMVLAIGRATQGEMRTALLRCAYNKTLKPKLDAASLSAARRMKVIQDVWSKVEPQP